jgi:hypothetical protein
VNFVTQTYAAHPDSQKRFFRFKTDFVLPKSDGYENCNAVNAGRVVVQINRPGFRANRSGIFGF